MLMTRDYWKSCVGFITATLMISAVMSAATVGFADGPSASPEKEKELIAVLKSDAPGGDKAIACKQLAIYGSGEAVSELEKLLPDPKLASWARIALEAIPDPAAGEALKKAAGSLEGLLQVGSINSVGVRRDASAVGVLTPLLGNKDVEVASAAAVALGRIGNGEAEKSLREALSTPNMTVRSAVAEGCVLCAEKMAAAGNSAEAIAIYDQIRKADVPKQRILEATRGAILSRKDADGIALLLEQFQSHEKGLFNIGLSTAREFPGGEVDKALAAELEKAAPERAALIVQAMADRKDTVVLAAVLKAAEKAPKQVRLSAVDALGRVGDATCLSSLLDIAVEGDEELSKAARKSLADLSGEKIDSEIVARLAKAEGKVYPLLLELVGQRRIEATDALLKALNHADKSIRSAALTALGETVALSKLSVLVAQVVAAKTAEDTAAATLALKTASIRMPDREACAEELAKALDAAPAALKSTLLEILADVGGTKALNTLGAACKSNDPVLQDVGSRVLGKWNSVDAAPVLLDLSKSAPGEKYQVRALRGYIGLVRKFAMPDAQRAEMCQKALDASKQIAEQKLVLDVLKIHPGIETLKLAIKEAQVPELKADATEVVRAIAKKLNSPEANELVSKAGLDK